MMDVGFLQRGSKLSGSKSVDFDLCGANFVFAERQQRRSATISYRYDAPLDFVGIMVSR
jgi:hypothetical protein